MLFGRDTRRESMETVLMRRRKMEAMGWEHQRARPEIAMGKKKNKKNGRRKRMSEAKKILLMAKSAGKDKK